MTVKILIVCGGSGVNLLGQRSVLGVHAELQIDASREIRIRQQRATDPFSQFVELDKNIGTTGFLFEEMRQRIRPERSSSEPRGSVYLREEVCLETDINHLRFLIDHSPANVALERGLAQSPAIGGLTIRHPRNRDALERALEEIATRYGIGPDNPVEAWIVSSTSGGTGEGTHRFVGAFLADFVQRRYRGISVTLNFVRVGQLTYRTVNLRQTALNTFFGVAADAAFTLKMPDDFPGVVTQWFYVDLPDVGIGDRSIPIRAQLVEMAAKSVMLEELQDDLQKLLVNNQGIPMVLTRTGYWGKDFEEKRKYYETLRQLREKLKALIKPDYERKYIGAGERRPEFRPGQSLQEWMARAGDARLILQRMERGWQFPRYRVRGYPQHLDEVRDLVEEWKRAVSGLVGESWEGLQAEWLVERVQVEAGEEQQQTVSLRLAGIGEAKFGEEEWFQRINEAHEARAWAWHLLGCDLEEGKPQRGGLVERLLQQAQGISAALRGFNLLKGNEARARDAAGLLGKFVELLAQVDVLLRLEDEARRLLEGQLSGARDVLDVADSEFEVVKRAVGGGGTAEVVRAADLSNPLEQATKATWLQLLRDAARRRDRQVFRKEVLRGATGITEAGLREVLGLRPQANIADMHQEMASRMGRMYDPDGNPYEAPWWAVTPATATMEYEYRILPWLSPELQALFQSYTEIQQARFRYIFTKMGRIGLYVLAFGGISLTRRRGDTVSMPAFLIKPFVPQVREALSEWKERPIPNEPSGQLRLVSAGVGGEPLYLRALQEAGLSEVEIEKIGQFYPFYE
ncbi:MAG: hypothetical protein ACPLYD_11335 [Anaerolineae bacterium]